MSDGKWPFVAEHRTSSVECAECGKVVLTIYESQKYCSLKCSKRAGKRRTQQRARKRAQLGLSPRPCGECGVIFKPEVGSKRRKYCTDRCGMLYHRHLQGVTQGYDSGRHLRRLLRGGTSLDLSELPTEYVELGKVIYKLNQEIFKQWHPKKKQTLSTT